jgi:hypothetical protein
MNRAIACLLLFACALSSASALAIRTAHTRHYDAGEIRPIRDYFQAAFSGQGFRAVVASRPDDPAGQYFIIRLKDWKSARLASARMTLYASDRRDPITRTWDLAGTRLDNWLYLGLTGADWPGEDVHPLAWRIELLDTGGNLLAEWKSFLWELP